MQAPPKIMPLADALAFDPVERFATRIFAELI